MRFTTTQTTCDQLEDDRLSGYTAPRRLSSNSSLFIPARAHGLDCVVLLVSPAAPPGASRSLTEWCLLADSQGSVRHLTPVSYRAWKLGYFETYSILHVDGPPWSPSASSCGSGEPVHRTGRSPMRARIPVMDVAIFSNHRCVALSI